jgi:segregation and condensation protein B
VVSSVSGGYSLRTHSGYSPWVQQLIAGRPVRLSRAQLETLAIVAYRQPITRPEIDQIRGVDSGATLKLLLDRSLIRILGKREEVGRPLLYGTTKEFLDFFSLNDLRELPTLREYSELSEESRGVVARMGLEVPPARSTSGASDAELIAAMTDGGTADGAAGEGDAGAAAATDDAASGDAPNDRRRAGRGRAVTRRSRTRDPVEDARRGRADRGRAVEDARGRARSTTLRSRTLRSRTLRSRTLRSTTLRSTTLRSTTLRSTTLRSTTLRSTTLRSTTLRSTTLRSTRRSPRTRR